ncbi:molybdate ABC transporter substrate-binding protein [Clostridium peptidivorans]|uniref:molybdate ABC transporter substrate-binding protein n=1 Tax=Clostridium peptidivorans TaxID=100174 RepID=UPI000BE38617|nr:molybdate ABC transporter substrate-binding protein [Clostridium peptidivorans]
MKKYILICVLFISCFFMFVGCNDSSTKENEKSLVISAASSLTDPLNEIKTNFEKENNIKININYAGSGTLRKQIEEGAPVDIYFSADKDNYEKLLKSNTIDKSLEGYTIKNEIVLIINKNFKNHGDIKSIEDLRKIKLDKLSIGTPETVPAGKYGLEALNYYNIFDNLKDDIVYGKTVKDVLNYVLTGNVDGGIVFKTDALGKEDKISIINIPSQSHSEIVYKCGILTNSKSKENAQKFLHYLNEESSKKIFEKYGFNY